MYLIYDTETTGLPIPGAPAGHPDQPYIMQLGAALVGEDFEIVEELDELVVLPEGVTPHPKAVEAHGITWGECNDLGLVPERIHELFSALAARAHTFVCHNVQFDSKLWAIFCARHGFANPVRPHICTMELMTPIMQLPQRGPRRGAYKWPKCQEAYGFVTGGQQFENAHDAMADVRATAVILRWLASTGQLPRRPSEALVGGQSTGAVPGTPLLDVNASIAQPHTTKWNGDIARTVAPEGKLTITYTSEVPRVPAPGVEQPSAQPREAGVRSGCVEETGLDTHGIHTTSKLDTVPANDNYLEVSGTSARPTFHIPIAHIQTR